MKQAVSFELYCYLYFLYFNILQYVEHSKNGVLFYRGQIHVIDHLVSF